MGLTPSKLARPPEKFEVYLDTLTRGDADDLAQAQQQLQDLRLLAQAVDAYRGLAHAAIVSFAPGRETEAVEPARWQEFERAIREPLDGMASESIPRSRLLHEQAKFYMFLGVLAGVGKLNERPDVRFRQAEGLLLESLRIKELCDAGPAHVLPTLVKLDELGLEKINFGQLRHRDADDATAATDLTKVRRQLAAMRARVTSRALQYEGHVARDDTNRALQGALGNCGFLLSRLSYLEAKAILQSPRVPGIARTEVTARKNEARELLTGAYEEASRCRDKKLEFDFPDGVFWAEAVMAKCKVRLLECGKSNEDAQLFESAVDRYWRALTVDRSRLWNLRSLCFLESLHRDVRLAKESETGDGKALKEWAASVEERLEQPPETAGWSFRFQRFAEVYP